MPGFDRIPPQRKDEAREHKESAEGVLLPVWNLSGETLWQNNAFLQSVSPQTRTQLERVISDGAVSLVMTGALPQTHEHTQIITESGNGRSGEVWMGDIEQDGKPIPVHIDAKGIGFVDETEDGPKGGTWRSALGGRDSVKIKGLLDRRMAELDIKMGERLKSIGVDIVPTLALIKLNELPVVVDGEEEIFSVDHLHAAADRAEGHYSDDVLMPHPYLPTTFEPVVQLRVFSDTKRLGNLTDESKRVAFDAAIIESQSESPEEYVLDIARKLAHNLGSMHANQLTHGYINPSNFMLNGALVDFDSVIDHASEAGAAFDFKKSLERDLARASWETDTWGALPSLLLMVEDIKTTHQVDATEQAVEVFVQTYMDTLYASGGAIEMRRYAQDVFQAFKLKLV